MKYAAIDTVRKSRMTSADKAMASTSATDSQEKYFMVPTRPSLFSVHAHIARHEPWASEETMRGQDHSFTLDVFVEALLGRYLRYWSTYFARPSAVGNACISSMMIVRAEL